MSPRSKTEPEAKASSRMEGLPPAAVSWAPAQGTVATGRTSHGRIKIQKPVIGREIGPLAEHSERGPSGEWEDLEGSDY